MSTSIDPQLLDKIRSSRALPSPPAVTARLIELGEDPNAGVDQILDVMKTDAALSARVLRLANSPLYARRRRTENLRQAVTLLGVDAVLTTALSLTLLTVDRAAEGMPGRFRRRRWSRSVHAAVSAQTLAHRVVGVAPSDAFLAALLQDIGVQLVMRLDPDAYQGLDRDANHADLIDAEIAAVGADHALIGAELLHAWHIPERVVNAVRHSHDALDHPADEDYDCLTRLVVVGGLAADGFQGELDEMTRASEHASTWLGINETAFAHSVEEITDALPDLTMILDAEPPEPHVIAEMAQDVMISRLMASKTESDELTARLATMTDMAATLEQENRRDPLTGLSNRRDLDEVLVAEFELAAEHGFPLSVLFVDLDDFKTVNDRFGHRVGDELLVESARRVSAGVRDGDVVGRYGGEEFVVVLPGASTDAADAAAERLVRSFDDRTFDLGSELQLAQTVSIGAATLDPRRPYEDVSALLHAADIALYAAKRTGKNRWVRAREADCNLEQRADLDLESDLSV